MDISSLLNIAILAMAQGSLAGPLLGPRGVGLSSRATERKLYIPGTNRVEVVREWARFSCYSVKSMGGLFGMISTLFTPLLVKQGQLLYPSEQLLMTAVGLFVGGFSALQTHLRASNNGLNSSLRGFHNAYFATALMEGTLFAMGGLLMFAIDEANQRIGR